MLCRVWHYIMVKPGEMSNFFLNVLHKITPNTGEDRARDSSQFHA